MDGVRGALHKIPGTKGRSGKGKPVSESQYKVYFIDHSLDCLYRNLEKHEAEMRPFQQQFEEIESVKVDFEQKIKQSLILSDKNMQNGIKLEEALFKLKEDITKAKGDFEVII